MENVYLTNDQLIRLNQNSMLAFSNSRSNSVQRLTPAPSHRNTHNPDMMNKINKLDDILKMKASASKKKPKLSSCITSKNEKCGEEFKKILQNIENSYYRSPPKHVQAFLNVYNADTKTTAASSTAQKDRRKSILKEDERELMKKESLKKFQEEFNNMQEKIKSRNNSLVDFNKKDDIEKEKNTLKKLNAQLQLQNQNLSERLDFEVSQNVKLNKLIENLNEQVAVLNSEIHNQVKDDQKTKEMTISKMKILCDQQQSQIQNYQKQIQDLNHQNEVYKNIEQNMQELDSMFTQISEISPMINIYHQLAHEIGEQVRIQLTIYEKIIYKREIQLEQIMPQRKRNNSKSLTLQDKAQETANFLTQIYKQLKTHVDQLTQSFIHDLLI